jgi:zinc carboxypeptidase
MLPFPPILLSILAACAAAPAELAQTPVAGDDAATSATEGELAWYLPSQVNYDANFPKPADVLGWEVGEWHVRHDQLVSWYKHVAENSPRMVVSEYAHTHEKRPLLLAAVSSPANLARLEEIRAAHVEAVRSGARSDGGPNIIWMGYSVHGNESSGANAALLLAYHLAAATGEAIDGFLERNIVLIDPCLNPDGLSRFAQWANMHKGQNLVADPNHREHNEGSPSGRTNHYWFDLNRDWLLLTHPESRGRVRQFQRWLPTVLTDFHEMGTDSTYFFQPGIPSRQNPLTPERNLELTRKIAEFHAEALDEMGSLYFTEEAFDDFYYGKGSTYPDLHGGVGILFEQASSRGHLQENSFGEISFPFTIRNQFTTSLSTLRAADAMRTDLMDWQREFYRTARAEARELDAAGYVFGDEADLERSWRMVVILRAHGIEVKGVEDDFEVDGQRFTAGNSFVVPLDQPQARLIRALFEARTSWLDNTFYDVSSWNLPLSFGLPYSELGSAQWASIELMDAEKPGLLVSPQLRTTERPVAYLFEWHAAHAPRTLQRLLAAGVRARVATKTFTCMTADGPTEFDYGTIVIPRGSQDMVWEELRDLMFTAEGDGVLVHAATGGLTPHGIDLGSRSIQAIEAPSLAIVVGGGASSYEAGEAWHELDTRVGMPATLLEESRLGRIDLDRYTHLVFVNGASSGMSESETEKLSDWVRAGGTLVATKSSAVWAARTLLKSEASEGRDSTPKEDPEAESDDVVEVDEPTAYVDYEQKRAEQSVAGTIFEAHYDRTNPLLFGYRGDTMPVFRNATSLLSDSDNPFATPMRYSAEPLLSGFASEENVAKFAGTPAIRAERLGSGTVICMIDNPLFRGVWWGTRRLFTNAIYFGPILKRTSALTEAANEEGAAVEDHGHTHGG